jgi:hypothetical protein
MMVSSEPLVNKGGRFVLKKKKNVEFQRALHAIQRQ